MLRLRVQLLPGWLEPICWQPAEVDINLLVPNMYSHAHRLQADCTQVWQQACPVWACWLSTAHPALWLAFPATLLLLGVALGHRTLQCSNWSSSTEVSALLQVCWSFCWMRGM